MTTTSTTTTNGKRPDPAELRQRLIAYARAGKRLLVTSTKEGQPCIVIGRCVSVYGRYAVLLPGLHARDALVPLDAIEDVVVVEPEPEART